MPVASSGISWPLGLQQSDAHETMGRLRTRGLGESRMLATRPRSKTAAQVSENMGVRYNADLLVASQQCLLQLHLEMSHDCEVNSPRGT